MTSFLVCVAMGIGTSLGVSTAGGPAGESCAPVARAKSPSVSIAWAGESGDRVSAGREAMGKLNAPPWYDSENDAIVPVDPDLWNEMVEPYDGPSDSDENSGDNAGGGRSGGGRGQRGRRGANGRGGSGGADPTGGGSGEFVPESPPIEASPISIEIPSLVGTILSTIVWIIVGTILVAIVALLVKLSLTARKKPPRPAVATTISASDEERVEALPFRLEGNAGEFIEVARRLYQAGHYRQAILYLYSHLLIELDRVGLVRLDRGKTNRQYLNEIGRRPEAKNLFAPVMVAFEDVFFGGKDLPRPRFESCWNLVDEFSRVTRTIA